MTVSPMHQPLLTIAIPTLRRLAYLREAVGSACAQDYPNFEVLISDDGDEPAIAEYAAALERTVSRVRYIRTSGGVGLAGNWNFCASHANGSHLVIIGDDDRLLPDFLKTLAPAVVDHDVVFCNHHLIDPAGRRRVDAEEQLRIYGRDQLPRGPVRDPEPVAWQNAVAPSATLVRTNLVRSLWFNPELNTPELEFYIRAACEGARFYFEPLPLAEYRTHPASETARGLWHDRLFLALLPIEARSPGGAAARAQQLVRLARIAVSEALGAGNPQVAASIARSGYLQNAPLRGAALLAPLLGSGPTRALSRLGRIVKRYLETNHGGPPPG